MANPGYLLLEKYFASYTGANAALQADINRAFEPFELARNQYLTREGEVEPYLYFVLEGQQVIGITVHKNDLDFEQVIAFSYTGHFTGSFPSLFAQNPSGYFIRTICASRFLRISRASLFALLDTYREMDVWMRTAAINLLAGSVNREKELLTLSPQQRYALFLSRSRHLVNEIPQKYIASYLGIAPETYSRLRKKTGA